MLSYKTLQRNVLTSFLIIFASLSTQAQEKADSVKVKIQASVDTLKSSGINAIPNAVKSKLTSRAKLLGRIDSIKPPGIFNKFSKDKLLAKNFSKDSVKKLPKVKFENFGFENSFLYINQNPIDSKPIYQNNISVVGNIQIGKIPVNVNFTKPIFSNAKYNPFEGNLFKMGFDKAKYLQGFQSDLTKATSFKKNALSGMDLSLYLQKSILKELKSSLGPKTELDPRLSDLLLDPVQVQQLLKMDASELKEKLRSAIVNNKDVVSTGINKKGDNAQNKLQSKLDTKEGEARTHQGRLDSTIFNNKVTVNNTATTVNNQLNAVKEKTHEEIEATVASATKVITGVRSKIDDMGLDQRRLELIEKFISNQANAQDLGEGMFRELSNQPKFKGLQKFYSKIQDLQAGGYGQKIPGGFMNSEMFVKGASITLNTARGPVTLGYGSNEDTGLPKDDSFNSSVFSSPKIINYLSVPTTRFAYGNGKLSWIGSYYKKNNSYDINNGVSSLPKNTMVFTISQNFKVNKYGRLAVDLSKSASQYRNNIIPGTEQLAIESSAFQNYFRDNAFETLSLGVNHIFDSKRARLSSKLYFNYSGIGYQNPGQQAIGNMSMRFGANFKKNFFKNKIAVSLRSDIKNTPISFSNNDHWRNYQFQVDSRYRLNKQFTFNLKYIDNGISKSGSINETMYSSKKIQGDLSSNLRIGKAFNFTHVSLGMQEMLNPIVVKMSKFANLNYSQTLTVGELSFSGSVFYNKELTGLKVMGDMINTDVGCQYSLFHKLNLASSLTFLSNEDIAKQAGIRQNVQYQFGKNLDVSAFIDVRKNLITPKFPGLFGNQRGELSLRYYLN